MKQTREIYENERNASIDASNYLGIQNETQTLELLTSKTLTTNDIGKIVVLNNKESECDEWIISCINEDGTVGLFPRFTIINRIKFGDTNIYKDSYLREWLNGEILNDKVKCPSLNEVGSTYNTDLLYEGTIYPIFGDTLINGTNPLSKYTTTDGSEVYYWTRSRDTGCSYDVWIVNPDGYRTYYYSYYGSLGAVACLRF